MSRPARQADRVVAIIDLLRRSPAPLTMTEIGRTLGIDQATTVHVLAVLEDAAFVVRSPETRRYDLGPGLVAPGSVAAARDPGLAIAREVMEDLTVELDRPCFCFAREGDHARLVQYTWPRRARVPGIRVGESFPLVPPLGLMFFVFDDDAGFEAWLASTPLDPWRVDRYHDQRATIREAGFIVEVQPTTAETELVAAIDDRPSPYRDKRLHRMLDDHTDGEHHLTEIDPDQRYLIHDIGAPVYGRDGDVDMSINVIGFDEPVAGSEITALGRRARAYADRVTAGLVDRHAAGPD